MTHPRYIPTDYDTDKAAQAVHQVLDNLKINYAEVQHTPIFTVEQAKATHINLPGLGCKSILLRTKKRDYYALVLLRDDHRADTRAIAQQVDCAHLSFANPEELMERLGLYPGTVSPFGIINDHNNTVEILIDSALVNNQLLFHPNANNRTISIAYSDLIKFMVHTGHSYRILDS